MIGFLIDTNVLSEYNRPGQPNQGVKNWLETTDLDLQYVSVLTLAEIKKGIELLAEGKRRNQLENWLRVDIENWFGGRILTVDRRTADCWAALMVGAIKNGKPLPAIDSLIAATAIAHDLTVVTRNTRDFENSGAHAWSPWSA